MADHNASRTLVKSAPELWAECSDATSLTRHLRAFGEIRITRLEPETAVAWEGDAASGTVRLEPSGWGTRVILSAKVAAPETVEVAPEEAMEVAPEAMEVPPEELIEVGPEEVETGEEHNPPKVSTLGRLLARLGFRHLPDPETSTVTADLETSTVTADLETSTVTADPEPLREPTAMPEDETTPEPTAEPAPLRRRPSSHGRPSPPAAAALDAALDSLGRAHHRPYSRA